MTRNESYADDLRRMRSLLIVTSLQKRQDLRALKLVEDFAERLTWDLDDLMIDGSVWDYAVNLNKYDPKLVFCHPEVVLRHHAASFYYRGLTGLSQKAARGYVGAIKSIETGEPRARLSKEKALRMARVYNTFICSIISGSTEWSLDDGRRTVLATLGISIDSTMRNRIGDLAEARVRSLVVEWLIDNDLLVHPTMTKEQLLQEMPTDYSLKGGVLMRFRPEPDISFLREGSLLAVVEIKGGVDPAGALERLGAAKKSFDDSKGQNPRCKCFYLAGVLTDETVVRIRDNPAFERAFDIPQILSSSRVAEEFFSELFHHALRIV